MENWGVLHKHNRELHDPLKHIDQMSQDEKQAIVLEPQFIYLSKMAATKNMCRLPRNYLSKKRQ